MRSIIERINNHIPSGWRNCSGLVKMLTGSYRILCVVDHVFNCKLNEAVACCGNTGIKPSSLKLDMLKEFSRSAISPEEYARFHFFEKDEETRKTYLSDTDVVRIFKWGQGNNILPNNKYERYCMFRQYFHRDIIRVCFPFCAEHELAYRRFISDKQMFIAKPLQGTQGRGVQKIDTKDADSLSKLSKLTCGDCLLEEMIVQGQELSKFHPSSVNTVRLVTGRGKNGKIEIIFALLRVGKGGSLVDNVGSGGLVSLIDLEKGIVCTDAFCGTTRYEKHPDTGVTFMNSAIPEWKELCETGVKMHQTHSGQRVFGFDFAWTENGWDVVEVNPAPSFASFQALLQKGCRPLLVGKQML